MMQTAVIGAATAAVGDRFDAATKLNNLGADLFVKGKLAESATMFEVSFQCATSAPRAASKPEIQQGQDPVAPDAMAVAAAIAAAKGWIAEGDKAQECQPQQLQSQPRFVPPPSVFALPVRLNSAAIRRNSSDGKAGGGGGGVGGGGGGGGGGGEGGGGGKGSVLPVGGGSGSSEAPATVCSDHERAAIAFNLALSHHLLGRSLIAAQPGINPQTILAHFRVALTYYQYSNEAASRRGYTGGLDHVARALLANMADIQGNVLGRHDAAEELLEEMDCVHDLTATDDDASGPEGWEDGCTLEIWSADLPPGAAPSA